MRTTWASWGLDAMQDAAEAVAHADLDALPIEILDFVETLPYFGAFDEYRWHVTDCRDCRDDNRADCAEGERLRQTARVGLEEQPRIALSN